LPGEENAVKALEKEKKLFEETQEIAKRLGIVSTVCNVNENPDSMELDFGGPRKGAKIYFDSSKPEDAKMRIKNVIELNKFKDDLLSGGEESDGSN